MSKRTKGRVASLAGESTKNFYDLSLAVKKLHEDDPGAFADIWKEKLLDRRTAYYLLDVGKLIEAGELSKAEAHSIGWTKLQIIARHLPENRDARKEEVNELLVIAANAKVRGLQAALGGQAWRETRGVVFHLTDQQREELNLALLSFGARLGRRGLVDKEKALMRIVTGKDAPTNQSA